MIGQVTLVIGLIVALVAVIAIVAFSVRALIDVRLARPRWAHRDSPGQPPVVSAGRRGSHR